MILVRWFLRSSSKAGERGEIGVVGGVSGVSSTRFGLVTQKKYSVIFAQSAQRNPII
jgi:hypothetical protein